MTDEDGQLGLPGLQGEMAVLCGEHAETLLCSPEIPHDLPRYQTLTAEEGSRKVTA
jgi:hypothetical protein